MPTVSSFSQRTRIEVDVIGQGLKGESFSRKNSVSSFLPTSGDVRGTSVGLLTGDVITNLCCVVVTAGSTVTKAQLALYSKAGVLLANTADSPTTFQSAGAISLALTSTYTVPAEDIYYIALFATATTMPTMLRGIQDTSSTAAFGSGAKAAFTHAGQAALPAPATLSANANAIWFGWN
jgi:hypothetical protein